MYLTLDQLRATAEVGAILSVTLEAEGKDFLVHVETRGGSATLIGTNTKTPRSFADPRKAMMMLREMGIAEVHINIKNWKPD